MGADSQGVQIHRSGAYDAVFGALIRRTDAPLLDIAEVAEGDRVLDVATGPGYLAIAAAKRVGPAGEAVGVDLSSEMIARARKRAQRGRSSARFVEAPAQQLPFTDGAFDVVLCRLAMHHLPGHEKERALAEMRRVLVPDGRLVIADLSSHYATTMHHLLGRLAGRQPEHATDLRELAQDAGFTEIRTGTVGVLAFVRAQRPAE